MSKHAGLLLLWWCRNLPNDPKRSITDGPVQLDVQLRLQVVRVVLTVMVSFDRGGLDLDLGRRSGGLSGCRRREVGLLLTGIEHHRRGRVAVVVVHVWRREVRELVVVVMRVMGGHR